MLIAIYPYCSNIMPFRKTTLWICVLKPHSILWRIEKFKSKSSSSEIIYRFIVSQHCICYPTLLFLIIWCSSNFMKQYFLGDKQIWGMDTMHSCTQIFLSAKHQITHHLRNRRADSQIGSNFYTMFYCRQNNRVYEKTIFASRPQKR